MSEGIASGEGRNGMRLRSSQLEKLAPLSDREIAARVVTGDTGAFELLMRRHNQRLFRTARSVLSNDADAQDALQEAYVRVYRGLPAFQNDSALITWMTRIVFNEAIRFRTRRSGVWKHERNGGPSDVWSQPEYVEPVMDGNERIRLFDEAMNVLSELERGVVMLRVIHGLTTRETAASLGISESNVKICLFRAKPKMATALEESGIEAVRSALSFDGERCDRLVAAVFAGLEDQGFV